MRKRITVFFFCCISSFIFASPYYLGKEFIHTDEYATVCINEKSIRLNDRIIEGQLHQEKKFNYFISTEENYIILDCSFFDNYFLYLIKRSKSQKFPYGKWEMTYNEILKTELFNASKLIPFTLISAESFITEKDKSGKEIKFLPEKSDFFSLGSNPWAVKADASKVINVSTKRWRHPTMKYYPIGDIVFVNGFVYPDKLYLYEQNSRAKRVKISYADTSFEAELKDTGNFQVVHLPAAIDPKADNDIRLEILDYYPGTKYSDVVISGLYYMDALVK